MSKVYKKRLTRPLSKTQDKLNKQDKSDSTNNILQSSPEGIYQKYNVSIF